MCFANDYVSHRHIPVVTGKDVADVGALSVTDGAVG